MPHEKAGVKQVTVDFSREFTRLLERKEQPIEFPYLVDPSAYMPGGKALRIDGLEVPESPERWTLITAVYDLAGLPRGGNIHVIGGASGLNLDGVPTLDELIKGVELGKELPDAHYYALDIYRAAHRLDANIITGGTQSGIMGLLSTVWLADSIISEELATTYKRRSKLLDIDRGASPQAPSLLHIVPKEVVFYPGNEDLDLNEWPAPLAPCSGFLIVGGGAGWGQVGKTLEQTSFTTSFLPSMETAIQELPQEVEMEEMTLTTPWSNQKPCLTRARPELDNSLSYLEHLRTTETAISRLAHANRKSARVSVIMNGGYLSIREAQLALDAGEPARLIALEGTGRFADLLSVAIKNNYTVPAEDHTVWDLPKVRQDYSAPTYQAAFGKLLDTLKAKQCTPYRAHIFRAGNEGLTSKIAAVMHGVRM